MKLLSQATNELSDFASSVFTRAAISVVGIPDDVIILRTESSDILSLAEMKYEYPQHVIASERMRTYAAAAELGSVRNVQSTNRHERRKQAKLRRGKPSK